MTMARASSSGIFNPQSLPAFSSTRAYDDMQGSLSGMIIREDDDDDDDLEWQS